MPQIYERLAGETEDLAREYAGAEREALERFREELPNLKASEAAGAVRNLATSRGISTDKAALLRNRTTRIVEHRSTDKILRKLQELGVIEVEADELSPPELPPV